MMMTNKQEHAIECAYLDLVGLTSATYHNKNMIGTLTFNLFKT